LWPLSDGQKTVKPPYGQEDSATGSRYNSTCQLALSHVSLDVPLHTLGI